MWKGTIPISSRSLLSSVLLTTYSLQTEIARRIAKLSQAPFIKVEATKFTEVGFHGKDVDQIIRDLLDVSIAMTKKKLKEVQNVLQ